MNLLRALLRSFTFRCPHCDGGRLMRSFYQFNERCDQCGYAYLPDDGDFWGGVVICYTFAGIVGIAAAGVLTVFTDVAVQTLIYSATLVTVAAVLLLFPWSKSLYAYLLYFFRGRDPEYRPPANFRKGH